MFLKILQTRKIYSVQQCTTNLYSIGDLTQHKQQWTQCSNEVTGGIPFPVPTFSGVRLRKFRKSAILNGSNNYIQNAVC